MKTPVFEEIVLKSFDLDDVRAQLSGHKLGEGSFFVQLETKDPEEAWEALDHIAIVFKEKDIHPCFPFPFYAVTPLVSGHPDLMTVPKLEDLPPHFYKKEKRLKNKEQSLLNKSSIIAQRIANTELEEKFSYLARIKEKQRSLNRMAKEGSFYEDLLKSLRGGS